MSVLAEPTKLTLPYVPTHLQRIFHACPADEVVFGGAAGPGKSHALLMAGILQCVNFSGSRCVYTRTTFPELEEMMDRSKVILGAMVDEGLAKYNENDHRWVFSKKPHPLDPLQLPRQSILMFSHLSSEAAVYQHQGKETDLFLLDEVTHLAPGMIENLTIWSRSGLPNGWSRVLMATNPGNIGHQYVRDGWVHPPDDDVELIAWWDDHMPGPDGDMGGWRQYKAGTRGRPDPFVVWRPNMNDEMRDANVEHALLGEELEEPRSRCFVPGKVGDNPHIDRAYKANLRSIKDERKRQMFLHGSWDIYEGMAFSEWDEKIHVRGDIEIMPWWRKWRSVDWGWRDPTAVYWHAFDPDKEQVVTYRELYVRETDDKELCERIHALTPKQEWIDFTVADPSMFAGGTNERGMSRADVWNKYGVPLTRAINKREAGFARVKQALALNPKTSEPNWIITRDCYNLRRTLPTLSYALNGKEDIEEKGAEDHAWDAARYGLLATPAFYGQPTAPIGAFVYKTY